MKQKFFIIIMVVIIIVTGILCVLLTVSKYPYFIYKNSETIDTLSVVDTVYVDVCSLSVDELMKGVQGDFTLSQVDSMRKSWKMLDSLEDIQAKKHSNLHRHTRECKVNCVKLHKK